MESRILFLNMELLYLTRIYQLHGLYSVQKRYMKGGSECCMRPIDNQLCHLKRAASCESETRGQLRNITPELLTQAQL